MSNTRNVYVASRTWHAQLWRDLRSKGLPICSTWIDEVGVEDSESYARLWSTIETEVAASAGLVLYIEKEDFPLSGAFVEVGMAIASKVPIHVVAPGMVLDAPTGRPIGSWVYHKQVVAVHTRIAGLFLAFDRIQRSAANT